jgi:signal transduction histidine kinase
MTVEQAAGSGWQAAVHPDDLRKVIEKWRTAAAKGEPVEYETRLRRGADGEYRWFQTRLAPLRDKRGQMVKWCGVATDIEDRKRAEQLQADLAHTNRVSLLGELAASISHELRQPITGAITSARACLRWLDRAEPDLQRARAAVVRIDKDGARASEIIDRLRALYKKTPPQRELVDVNEIIGEMAVLLRSEAYRFGVSIRTDLAADLLRITADRVQLQQVLMNLMLNAIEAMKETGGVMTVKSQRDENGQVLISVSDTGVGLPAEKADQIFNAFFTTKPQGSGMGLAISRSIVESHGGRLWATPNDGRGATFQFTLPIQPEAEG